MPQPPDFNRKFNSLQRWEEVQFAANMRLRSAIEGWLQKQPQVNGVEVKILNAVTAKLDRILTVGQTHGSKHKIPLDTQGKLIASINVYGIVDDQAVQILQESIGTSLAWLQGLQSQLIGSNVVDHVSVIIYQAAEIDDRWVLTHANQALVEFIGLPADSFIGANAKHLLTDFVHPDDVAQLLSSYDFARTTTRLMTLSYRLKDHTGSYITVTERVEYYPSKKEKRCNSIIWHRAQDQINVSEQDEVYTKIENFSQDINIETGHEFLRHFCRRLETTDSIDSTILMALTKDQWWETYCVSRGQVAQANFHINIDTRFDLSALQWNRQSILDNDSELALLLFDGNKYRCVLPLFFEGEETLAVLLLGSSKPLTNVAYVDQMTRLFGIRILREIDQIRIADAQYQQNKLLTRQKHQLTQMVSLLGQLDTVSDEFEFLKITEFHLRKAFDVECIDWLFWSSGEWFYTRPMDEIEEETRWYRFVNEVTSERWIEPLEECRRTGETTYRRGRFRVFWPIGRSEAGFLVCALTFRDALPDDELIRFSQNALALAQQGLNQRENLRYQAMRDSLTGLGNRVQLHAWMKAGLPHLPQASLLLFDLNRFKEINDSFGHQFGDKLLQKIGPRISQYLSNIEHHLARLGGDEFALLLPNVVNEEANDIGVQLHAELARSYVIDGLRFQVEASVGVAHYPKHASDGHELLRCADVAMYAAKNNTRDVVAFTSELDNATPMRIAVLSGLDEAIAEDQLWVAYQPLMSTATGQVAGFEALIRWTHPEFGPLSPGDFIPITEMGEGIRKITDFVLRQTMKNLQQWRQLMPSLHVAVNVSPRVLLDHQFPTNIQHLLDEFDLPGDALILELTESTLLVDPIRAVEIIDALAEKGIKVEIDDFGTGYSSLAYLKSLPISALKIDRSFVTDILEDSQNEVIVASTIQMAHSLGLMTVAEGVEDEATLQKMMRLGCDMIQGYYFSKPIAGANVTQWLKRNL